MALFEVQEFNLCGGWANNWSFEDDNGVITPTYFESRTAAETELDYFLMDCDEEVEAGNMADAPNIEDFRIVEVQL